MRSIYWLIPWLMEWMNDWLLFEKLNSELLNEILHSCTFSFSRRACIKFNVQRIVLAEMNGDFRTDGNETTFRSLLQANASAANGEIDSLGSLDFDCILVFPLHFGTFFCDVFFQVPLRKKAILVRNAIASSSTFSSCEAIKRRTCRLRGNAEIGRWEISLASLMTGKIWTVDSKLKKALK